MRKKIDVLREHMRSGRWNEAITLAGSFSRLGEHKVAITRAKEAVLRPDFQRQLGRDIDSLIAEGVAALKERYPIS